MAQQHDGFDVHQQYNVISTYEAPCGASTAGFTCADTANSDRNQKGVGEAIRGSTQSRDKLIVMMKRFQVD